PSHSPPGPLGGSPMVWRPCRFPGDGSSVVGLSLGGGFVLPLRSPGPVGDFQSHCPSVSRGGSHHARAPTLACCSLSRPVRIPAGRCEIRAVRSGEMGQFPCADNPRRSEKFLHFSQFYTVNRFYSVADTGPG